MRAAETKVQKTHTKTTTLRIREKKIERVSLMKKMKLRALRILQGIRAI